MKTRLGFVSNSSSSSFLVKFPKAPVSAEHVKEMLFGDEDVYLNPYPWNDRPKYWPAQEIADIVWKDIELQGVGQTVYDFTYSDHTILGSAMEHGTLFDRVFHRRKSHH